MDPAATPQFLPETLFALGNFVTLWNADPISRNSSLIITGNQISIINEENTAASFQFPHEAIRPQNNLEENIEILQKENTLENLLTTIDFADENYATEDLDRNLTSPELVIENTILEATSTLDQEQNITPPLENNPLMQIDKDTLSKIRKDLIEESDRPLIRITPLLATTWKAQIEEIISRIQKGTCGQDRLKQVQTLEACNYLGRLLVAQREDKEITEEIQELLRKALGKRRTYKINLGAERITSILDICGRTKLYATQYITLSNIISLNKKDFKTLLEDLRIYGVNS